MEGKNIFIALLLVGAVALCLTDAARGGNGAAAGGGGAAAGRDNVRRRPLFGPRVPEAFEQQRRDAEILLRNGSRLMDIATITGERDLMSIARSLIDQGFATAVMSIIDRRAAQRGGTRVTEDDIVWVLTTVSAYLQLNNIWDDSRSLVGSRDAAMRVLASLGAAVPVVAVARSVLD